MKVLELADLDLELNRRKSVARRSKKSPLGEPYPHDVAFPVSRSYHRVMSKQQDKIGTALAIVGVTGLAVVIASADPQCDRGCKNNLQHLFEHVLGDVIKGLLA